jgi:hypothetical protein
MALAAVEIFNDSAAKRAVEHLGRIDPDLGLTVSGF